MNQEEKSDFEKRLTEVSAKGVLLYLEGQLSSPEEIARTYCINEDRVYMPDYVLDEEGFLKEVHYDRIENY